MNDSVPPKPKLRWYQFSLRTLLIATLVTGVFFGWLGTRLQRARKNREAEAEVFRIRDEIAKAQAESDLRYPECSPSWLERLIGDPVVVPRVHSVRTPVGREIDDTFLEHLKGLTDLKELDLGTSHISDAGLVHLKGLTKLESLSLSDTLISDTGLEHIKGLTDLEELDLRYTKYVDAELVHLKRLTRLKELDLSGTQITDAGLIHLKELTNLKSLGLGLGRTQVTDEGMEKLRQALPHCRIERESLLFWRH